MSAWLLWLFISGSLLIAEIFTLSFYLLLAAIGALVASGLAASGFDTTAQIVIAAIVTFAGWILLNKFKPQNLHPDHRSNPDLNMDIGTVVRILSISAEGRISVLLRGARWDAAIENNEPADITADYIITKIDGSTLILTRKV